ncbi:MAG: sigma-70 family RNA polymerase sigma factor [Candidatus Marinimicrobia bacterium]|nr:sigma-70 family RNA polymerase sigma factor [Candidatus Neomarinimicrobiota bacterium]
MEDSELILKFLDGDVQAFNVLVNRWQVKLFNFAFKVLGRREDAKDVTQKAFIRAYKSLRKLNDPGKFSPWIYQITMNLCRDEMRIQRRSPSLSLHDTIRTSNGEEIELQEFLTDDSESADDALYQGEVAEIIRKGLKMIPEEQRIVIIMKEYQGLKFREISEILQEPLNTVKSRMYYGLNALRKALSSLEIDKEVFQYEL